MTLLSSSRFLDENVDVNIISKDKFSKLVNVESGDVLAGEEAPGVFGQKSGENAIQDNC